MNCEECNNSLIDYIDGELSQSENERIESHLSSCSSCADEYEALKNACSSLDNLPKPSKGMQPRFVAALDEYKKGQLEGRQLALNEQMEAINPLVRFWRNGFAQAAIIAIAFTLGVVGSNTLAPKGEDNRLASIETELASLREFTAISLLNQTSAAERLRGLEWIASSKVGDNKTLDAVYKKLNYDPNINVRFAALETLDQHASESHIRKKLVQLLDTPNSPLIRAELIKLLVRHQELDSIPSLIRISQDPDENPTIRELAMWSLEKLGHRDNNEV